MRELSEMPKNIFTTKLHDVILVGGDYFETLGHDSDSVGPFLVMDYVESDAKKVLESIKYGTVLSEDHIITMMYNILCSL